MSYALTTRVVPPISDLLLLETAFLVFALPETRGKRAQSTPEKVNGHANGNSVTNGNGVTSGNGITNGNGHANGTGAATNGHANGNGVKHTNGHSNGNGVKAETNGHVNGNGVSKEANGKTNGVYRPETHGTPEQRIKTLSVLRTLHFLFLGLFSGVEFTLTFLTFDCTWS